MKVTMVLDYDQIDAIVLQALTNDVYTCSKEIERLSNIEERQAFHDEDLVANERWKSSILGVLEYYMPREEYESFLEKYR